MKAKINYRLMKIAQIKFFCRLCLSTFAPCLKQHHIYILFNINPVIPSLKAHYLYALYSFQVQQFVTLHFYTPFSFNYIFYNCLYCLVNYNKKCLPMIILNLGCIHVKYLYPILKALLDNLGMLGL